MIAIRYSGNVIPSYEAFCETFDRNVKRWLQLGYVGKSDKHVDMDDSAYRFFNEIRNDGIKKIAYLGASNLIGYIDDIEERYPELAEDRHEKSINPRADVSQLYKCIEKAFSNYGYDSSTFPGDDLINDLGLTVCPYCNRNFIKHIVVDQNDHGDDIAVKGQLDHFYPRSLYPYLAITRENLVPSCPSCNGASGKHDKDTKERGAVNPYILRDSEGLKFRMKIEKKGFTNLDTCAKAIKIEIETPNPALAANEQLFHIGKLYATHTDYAAEMYFKSILRFPQTYWNAIGERFEQLGLAPTKEDMNRLITGVYTDEKDYHKRPLSKFLTDIAKDDGGSR